LDANRVSPSHWLVGGLGFNTYKRMTTVSGDNSGLIVNPLLVTGNDDDLTFCGLEDNACYRFATDSWRTKFSWNFGFGTDFHIGSQDMFVEWRWNPIRTHSAWTWYMPISLGLRYF
jgi:hypothetical protein